jgi:hypothetical protein
LRVILPLMTDNNKWLDLVVTKLNALYMKGTDFFDERWVFEWDDKLSKTDNFKNANLEERALNTLTQAGVIQTRSDENWYRNQVIDAQEELEIAKSVNPKIPKEWTNTVWGDWHETDPAHREYDNIWFLDGFDYDRFQQFCETHGFKPSLTETKQLKSTKHKEGDVTPTPEPNSIPLHPLEPRHYSIRKGILTLSPTDDVSIAIKGRTRRPDKEKYIQCQIMEKLFKSVNNIKYGINFGQALTVNNNKIGKKEEKKISNAVSEINKKVASVGGPDNLIKIQNKKVFVNNSYLE